MDCSVQYSTVRSWFDCFDGLPFGLVYHLGVWKISSCFATLFIAHQFWRNKVYKEIILELNDPIGRTMVQCFVTSNSPKTYSSFLSNQNDTWNIECNQVNRKTTWKHIWTIFALISKLADKSTFVSVRKRHDVSVYLSTLRTLQFLCIYIVLLEMKWCMGQFVISSIGLSFVKRSATRMLWQNFLIFFTTERKHRYCDRKFKYWTLWQKEWIRKIIFALLVHVDNLLGEMLPIRWPNDKMTVPYNVGESI